MPITYSHSYGFSFSRCKKTISKRNFAIAKQLFKNMVEPLDMDTYESMLRGELAIMDAGGYGQPRLECIHLEPYLAGASEPILLEQEVIPFPAPHLNRSAIASWRADIVALQKQLSEAGVVGDIAKETQFLADSNYSIAAERQDDADYRTPQDYIGDFCAGNDDADSTIPKYLKYIGLDDDDDEHFTKLRARDAAIKAFYATCPISQDDAGAMLRGIDARERLIQNCSQ